MATDYHVVTLPNKSKVPVRDHFLRDGREFSVTGDVSADAVVFDGTDNVTLEVTIGAKKVTLEKLADDAICHDMGPITPGDNRLVTSGAVAEAIAEAEPVPLPHEKIDRLFDF